MARKRKEEPLDDRTPDGVLKIHVGSAAWLALATMQYGAAEAKRIQDEFRKQHPDLQDARSLQGKA